MKIFLFMMFVFCSAAIVSGQITLPEAIKTGQLDVVISILESGIDINAPVEETLNPLMIAAREGQMEIASQLLTGTGSGCECGGGLRLQICSALCCSVRS